MTQLTLGPLTKKVLIEKVVVDRHKIKSLREKKRYTIGQLAKRLNTSYYRVWHLENAGLKVSQELINALEKELL